MPVFLGQLVYTSFPRVGFRLLASTQVPMEVQQAFMQQVVYQHWDNYNPPKYGYRAVYLHQVTSKHNLFGWLYNDGLDDLGRNHVPYFVCYYLAERLHAVDLENIFTCLHKGPIALMDRHSPPGDLGTIVAPDFSSYQPARIGVAIPANVRERSHIVLKQRKLLNLFIPFDEREVATSVPQVRPSGQDTIPLIWGNQSQPLLGTQTIEASVPTFWGKPVPIRLVIGIISLALVMLGSYYFLRPPAPSSLSLQNTSPGNVFLTKTLTGHSDSVWSIALGQNDQTLVSGSADRTIKVWNLNTGQLIRTLSGHTDIVRSVALSSDGEILASGSGDRTIKLWNLQTGRELRTLSGHSGPLWSIAISRDGKTLVSGSEDSTIRIWNLQTGELLRSFRGHTGRVFSVALSPNDQTLASSGVDKTIKIWNLQTGKLLRTLTGHSDFVRAVTISSDGQKLASGSWDKTVKVWNLQTGELLHTFEGHTDRVVSVAFSPDGQTLASASSDKTVKIWSLLTGKLVGSLSGHSDWVLSVAISPSGRTLVSSSKDKTIKIWQP